MQFEPNTVSALHAALLRERVKDAFPAYEEQVARPPMAEEFRPPSSRPPISFELMTGMPGQRHWFISKDGSRLVQVQHDLLAVNWRRLPGATDEYPTYSALRELLMERLGDLEEILRQEEQPPLKPNWCEVTYINHIAPIGEESVRPPLDRVLRWFSSDRGGDLPQPEDVQLSARFPVDADQQRGRFHVTVGSAFRAEDGVPLWIMTLTGRLRSMEPTTDAAMAALDEARERADRAFVEITTEEMHEAWGLKERGQNEFTR